MADIHIRVYRDTAYITAITRAGHRWIMDNYTKLDKKYYADKVIRVHTDYIEDFKQDLIAAGLEVES